MGRTCDYYIERSGKDYCALKNEQISYQLAKDYCRRDDKESCPIYLFFEKNR